MATLEGRGPVLSAVQSHGWIGQLRFEDLQRLREAVRRVHRREQQLDGVSRWRVLTDREADQLIDALGPVTAEKLLKAQVDRRS